MAMLINYKYDKDHDYIVKSEISQNENQLDNNRKVVIYDRPLLNVLQLSYKETLEVANRLVKYLKERENWNIKDIVTEDGIMELLWGKNHPLV